MIRVLPDNLASMIAAGEVVGRPASVVKELMENAIDAGADRVDVVVTDAGRTQILVIDNGSGMSADDAALCFERHATSKLSSVEDLGAGILTFGFRGEALPSIAAVSQVQLKTRRGQDELGTEVNISGSSPREVREVSCPKGTSVSVRNLFFNVPARRKFLKSDNVELRHIIDEFERVAMLRYDKAFSLTAGSREIYVLKPALSQKMRLRDLFGDAVTNGLLDFSLETSGVKIEGYVGRPDAARKGLGNQFFFVNGRYFRSPYLNKAVMGAYEHLLPEGLTPSYFLHVKVDPAAVDVNVSPTKTEVKFEEPAILYQALYAGIREVLGRQSFAGSIDFATEGVPVIPVFTQEGLAARPLREPGDGSNAAYNPFAGDGFPDGGLSGITPVATPDFSPQDFGYGGEVPGEGGPSGSGAPSFPDRYAARAAVTPSQNYGKLFEENILPSTQTLVLQGKYICTPVSSGMMVIHIRRARQRILFDRFLSALSGNAHVTQTALFETRVQVGADACLLFAEHAHTLEALGFDIRPFGADSVVVCGVPEGFSCESGKAEEMVFQVLGVLREGVPTFGDQVFSTLAERFAESGAAGGKDLTSPREAQRLIDALFASTNAEYTARGKRIMTIISVAEFDRKF